MIRIFVVDDHPIVRGGIISLLQQQPDMQVIGQSGDGLDGLEGVEAARPDVVVLDLMLPGLSGFEVARRVAAGTSGARVLVLTFHSNEAYAAAALSGGASGFVQKDAEPAEILRAVRAVADGRRHFLPKLAESRGSPFARDPWETLSDREREVVQLVAEGLCHADTGLRLGISARTVEVHRGNAMRKLHLESPVELVRFLLRRGILAAEG